MRNGTVSRGRLERLGFLAAYGMLFLGLASCSSTGRKPSEPTARVANARAPAPSGSSATKEAETIEIAVRLHDRDFNPTPNVAYQLTLASGETMSGTTDSEGDLHAVIAKGETGEMPFSVTYQPVNESQPITIKGVLFPPEEGDTDRALLQEIRNLGFGGEGASDSFVLLKFQAARKLRRTGKLDEATKKAVRDTEQRSLRESFDSAK
jgi:hypothetical protein